MGRGAVGAVRSSLRGVGMPRTGLPQLTVHVRLRIAADAVMVNGALIVAMAGHCLWTLSGETVEPAPRLVNHYVVGYLNSFWLLTLTCVFTFYLSGFYTRTRAYAGRYKALAIARAVSLSYLIFAFELLLLRDVISFPRSALLVAWPLTLIVVIAARLSNGLWSAFSQAERSLLPPPQVPVKPASVLVIGGAGYIGSVLVARLLELGYRVRVLDLLVYGDESISGFCGDPHFELIRGDFCHIDTMVRATQGMDAIVHLGAIVGDAACQLCEDLTVEINLRATRTIAEVGQGFGVQRFVFASTCSVYGASDEILDERSALNPLSLYARTKVASEQVLLAMADGTFAPTILRFGTIYGLSRRPRFDLVVNVLAAKALQDGECGIVGGSQWRPLVHVKDVAEAIILTLKAPRDAVCGQVFNVGSNAQNYQIAELGRIIGEMVPTARVVSQPSEDLRNYRVCCDKIARTLNFEPKYTIRDGVSEIITAIAEGRIKDYRDARYNNTSFLRQNDDLRRTVMKYITVRDCLSDLAASSRGPAGQREQAGQLPAAALAQGQVQTQAVQALTVGG